MDNQIKITITGPQNGNTQNVAQIISMAIKKTMWESNYVIVVNRMGQIQHPASDVADIIIDVLKK